MDLTLPTGYRPYNSDPQTPTGIQSVTSDQAGSGYHMLANALAIRLSQRTSPSQLRSVICIDLYHSPNIDSFLDQFRAIWETAYSPATWIDTRTALKEPAVLAQELQEFL